MVQNSFCWGSTEETSMFLIQHRLTKCRAWEYIYTWHLSRVEAKGHMGVLVLPEDFGHYTSQNGSRTCCGNNNILHFQTRHCLTWVFLAGWCSGELSHGRVHVSCLTAMGSEWNVGRATCWIWWPNKSFYSYLTYPSVSHRISPLYHSSKDKLLWAFRAPILQRSSSSCVNDRPVLRRSPADCKLPLPISNQLIMEDQC